jgi:MFS family permease
MRNVTTRDAPRRPLLMPAHGVRRSSARAGDTPTVALQEPLPAWWLLFLGGFCFCPAVTNNCVLPLLLPPLVEWIVGPAHKAASLGMLSTAGFSLGLSMPFLGMLSDRMTGAFGRRFGRRRPFIIVGQLLNSAGLVVLALATSFGALTLGYMMLYAGNILACE